MIDVWLGVDQSKHHEHTCAKEIGLRLQISSTTPHSMVNTTGMTSANHN